MHVFFVRQVEPLDMNEVELFKMISMMNMPNVIAVSPIIKVTASEVTKRPITVYVPKPGLSIYGSTKLGARIANRVSGLFPIRCP